MQLTQNTDTSNGLPSLEEANFEERLHECAAIHLFKQELEQK